MAILAEGAISATRAVIFETGTSGSDFRTDVTRFSRADITKITMFNNIATPQTVILSVKKKFGVFRKLRQFKLNINENGEYLEPGEVLSLQAGDVLEAETSNADAVDFVVYGELS